MHEADGRFPLRDRPFLLSPRRARRTRGRGALHRAGKPFREKGRTAGGGESLGVLGSCASTGKSLSARNGLQGRARGGEPAGQSQRRERENGPSPQPARTPPGRGARSTLSVGPGGTNTAETVSAALSGASERGKRHHAASAIWRAEIQATEPRIRPAGGGKACPCLPQRVFLPVSFCRPLVCCNAAPFRRLRVPAYPAAPLQVGGCSALLPHCVSLSRARNCCGIFALLLGCAFAPVGYPCIISRGTAHAVPR